MSSFKTPLHIKTSLEWVNVVMSQFDSFLLDHAAAEKKASGMAISMISHYPDKKHLVEAMAELAIEEMNHYREVIKIIHSRGLHLQPDSKDLYMNQFRKHMRKGSDVYFLDRLLIASIVEARGAERFYLISQALTDHDLKMFYTQISESEQEHYKLFLELAARYFDSHEVNQRFDELLQLEAGIIATLRITAALH